MPRYHFHLHECGDITPDEEGVEIANLDDAHTWAIQAARDVMCGEVETGHLCLGCAIVIADAQGQEVGRVPFKQAVKVVGF